MLQSLGVALDGPALMVGDNMSVVLNTLVPSSVLMKKHNAIAYHCVREAISAKIFSNTHPTLCSKVGFIQDSGCHTNLERFFYSNALNCTMPLIGLKFLKW